MAARDLFGVIVRGLGLWFIIGMATSLLNIFVAPAAILFMGPQLIVGLFLFFKADSIVRMAYGRIEAPSTFSTVPRS